MEQTTKAAFEKSYGTRMWVELWRWMSIPLEENFIHMVFERPIVQDEGDNLTSKHDSFYN